ncbi:unnamed protein product [marine sediment metagenome]|uniref:Uncharacterized protein n=1 Tax=marine sediment metagenome TaxID=412755 RepID=X1J2D4_9ZZZZ
MRKQSRKVSASDDAPPVRADFIYDATEELIGRKLKEGLNHIMRGGPGLELVVRATPNEAIEYMVLDRDGERIDEVRDIKVVNNVTKETTCWECGLDADGDTHCWKVPCPDIVGPWVPASVIAIH